MRVFICSLLAAAILLSPCGVAIGAQVGKELQKEKVNLLMKPFSPEQLAKQVREVLDSID